jgi:hypothetical protein
MRALLLLAFLCIAVFVMSVARPDQPVSAQQAPLNQLLIGKVSLSGDFWDVLNLQGVTPGHHSELRLFPKSGTVPTDVFDPVGGELTLSGDDLNNLNSSGDYHVLALYAYNQEYRMQSGAGGSATPYPIKFDSMGGYINFTLNTNGSLGIARGISNTEGAGGFSHVRIQSCSGSGITCVMQVTWQTDFADTNYTATCTLGGAIGSVNWLRKEPGYLVVKVFHDPGATEGGEIDCVGIHD